MSARKAPRTALVAHLATLGVTIMVDGASYGARGPALAIDCRVSPRVAASNLAFDLRALAAEIDRAAATFADEPQDHPSWGLASYAPGTR